MSSSEPERRRSSALREGLAVLALLVLAAAASEVPPVKAVLAAIDAERGWLLPVTIGLCAGGFLLLVLGFGGVARREGRSMTREEFEQLGARTQLPAPGRVLARARFRGRHRGVVLPETEWRFADLKAALRDGSWRGDPAIRGRLLTTAGGLLFVVGFFGLFVVLVEVSAVKMLLIGALVYVVVRLGWAIAVA